MNGRIHKSVFALSTGLAAVFIAFGWLPDSRWWGINHLSYYSLYARIVFSLLAILALLPPVWKMVKKAVQKPGSLPDAFKIPLLLLISAGLFIFLRVAVHSLGDGYQRAYEIERDYFYRSTEILDFFIHAAAYHLINLFGDFKAATAMAATSIIAGVAFVYMLFRMAPFSGWKRCLLIMAILSLGSNQLFFGYVESYTLLYLFVIWYLFLAFRPEGKEAGFGLLTAVYLLAGFSHIAGIILIISYMFLARNKFGDHPKRLLILPGVLAISLLPLLIPVGLNHLLGVEETRTLSGYFLPIVDETYGVISPLHLFDILNQFLLVAPVGLVILHFLPRIIRPTKKRLLAWSMFIPAGLFILLFNPELTMARDWDLLSVPMAICVIPFFFVIFESLTDDSQAALLRLTSLPLIAIVIMSSWVILNNHTPGHLRRAEYILDHAVRSKRYGCELLAYYYGSHNDHENELRVLQKIDPAERTARIYGKISQDLYILGRLDEAYQMAQTGVNMENRTNLNAVMAGVTAFERGEYNRAIYFLRISSVMVPNDLHSLCKLGDALFMADSLEGAIQVFGKAMALDRREARPHIGLAYVYYKKGEYELAAKFCREGLARDRYYAGGKELLDRLRKLERDSER
jgi:hypothetical protein